MKQDNIYRLMWPVIALFLVIAVTGCGASGVNKEQHKVNIGTPDDSGGLIIHYLIHNKAYAAVMLSDFELYAVKDCCSSTAQWALAANEYDIAIMCPDAAQTLLEKDDRFVLAGPTLVNSAVAVVREGREPKKIGVAQKREHQSAMVEELFGASCAQIPMLPSALPYAYEKDAVDGVVADVLTALDMRGEVIIGADRTHDYVTYVLVATKIFAADPRYTEFLSLFAQASQELNRPEVLAAAVSEYKDIQFGNEEVKQWNRLGIKHVYTIPATLE